MKTEELQKAICEEQLQEAAEDLDEVRLAFWLGYLHCLREYVSVGEVERWLLLLEKWTGRDILLWLQATALKEEDII